MKGKRAFYKQVRGVGGKKEGIVEIQGGRLRIGFPGLGRGRPFCVTKQSCGGGRHAGAWVRKSSTLESYLSLRSTSGGESEGSTKVWSVAERRAVSRVIFKEQMKKGPIKGQHAWRTEVGGGLGSPSESGSRVGRGRDAGRPVVCADRPC